MKHINLKRFASAAMAGVLALGLVIPAAAADSNSTVIKTTYKSLDLAVTVDPVGKALINPYGLPITLEDDETVISGEQITTAAPLLISNQSEVDLKVTATVTGTTKGTGVAFVATDIADTETNKQLNVKFEAFAAPGLDEDNFDDEDVLDPMFAALSDRTPSLSAQVDGSNAATATGDLFLKRGDDEETQDGGVAFVRLSGTVAKNPTGGWTKDDGFTVTIAYTFEPEEYVGAPILTTSAKELSSSNTVATLEVALTEGVKAVEADSVKWTNTGSTTYFTFVGNPTVSNGKLTATLTYVKSHTSSDQSATVSVTYKGDNGITYKSSPVTVTIPAKA